MKKWAKLFAGEFIGTCLMVIFGVGAVATTTLFGAMTGAYQAGMIWGVAIAVAIYVTRHLSGAHFNPAVSIAMVTGKRMSIRELPIYLIGQFCGAFIGAFILWILFADSVIFNLENAGLSMSQPSAASSIWCEVFPNTPDGVVPPLLGAFTEGLGVFLLIIVIFSLTATENLGRPNSHLAPLFIGLTVTVIIGTIGPLTNSGINPARDIGPRIVASIVGFGEIAFSWDVILVYTIGPIIGAILAALLYNYVISPLHNRCVSNTGIPCPDDAHLCEVADECDKKAALAMTIADNLD